MFFLLVYQNGLRKWHRMLMRYWKRKLMKVNCWRKKIIIRKFHSLFRMISNAKVKPIIFQLDLLGSPKHHRFSFYTIFIFSNWSHTLFRHCGRASNLQLSLFLCPRCCLVPFIICVYPRWMTAIACNFNGKLGRRKSLLFLYAYRWECNSTQKNGHWKIYGFICI